MGNNTNVPHKNGNYKRAASDGLLLIFMRRAPRGELSAELTRWETMKQWERHGIMSEGKKKERLDIEEKKDERIEKTGQVELDENGKMEDIHLISIIGEICSPKWNFPKT